MNFSSLMQCCFPVSSEQMTINKQETYKENTSTDNPSHNNTKSDKFERSEREEEKTNDRSHEKTEEKTPKRDRHANNNKIVEVPNSPKLQPSSLKRDNINSSILSSLKNNIHSNKGKMDNNSILSFKSFNNGLIDSSIDNNSRYNETNKFNKTCEDSSVDFINLQRMITESDIKNANQLLLEELEGDILKNNKLMINAAGLINGARKTKDGVAYFGTQYKNTDNITINDYVLNFEMKGIGAYVFIIYFKKETNKYYIRAFRDKVKQGLSLVLVKLDTQYYIKKKEILSIGDIYFQIQLSASKIEIIKLASKSSPENTTYVFDNEDGEITIGRDKSCNISFLGNKSFSRVHTTLEYDKLRGWKIYDGSKGKSSTNGSWIFAAHSYEIQDGTIFKICNSKLRLTLLSE